MKTPKNDDAARGPVQAIAAGLARAQDAAGCPDPTTLAAFVERRLGRSVRRSVEEHLARCSDCTMVAATLAQAAPVAVGPRRLPPPATWLLAAAAVLLALGAIFWPHRDATMAQQLQTAAAELRTAAPDLFAQFTPLSDAELAERPAPDRSADALSWVHPSGTGLLRELQPDLVFEGTSTDPVPFRIDVERATDGVSLGKGEGRLLPMGTLMVAKWPLALALPQGQSSALRLVVRTPAGERTIERVVTTAPAAAVAAYEQGAAAIRSRHHDDVGDALRVHLALRARFLREAEHTVLDLCARHPDEPAFVALRQHVRAHLGLRDQE